ncbi:unnamed protein product [Acanthoscelides obtectus]|uniref:MADF domain-containing protein n=1 Tax=Acanthoscelides obtectus TaxID=200917 RepID=A0A9P0KWQ9_ACAOB|nr:unnamed protein product [Acanthoscelides obtectus]CAK1650915.1 hypothetical protein AOBTE_LOCUS16971 [Acanthoscelides obtectus]
MKWSEEETMHFVELYSEKECLWKKSSVNYRNKNMRRAAEGDIANRMEKESFGVAELKQKIKIMRTTCNQEALKETQIDPPSENEQCLLEEQVTE